MLKEEDFIYEDRLIYLDRLIYFLKKYRNSVERLYNHDFFLEDLIIFNDYWYECLFHDVYESKEILSYLGDSQ